MEATAVRPPDVDERLVYPSDRPWGACRLRVWRAERVVMLTELGDNPGPSVTNSIEAAARAASERLGGERIGYHASGYALVEHYPHDPPTAGRGPTFDEVTFRECHPGSGGWHHIGPTWHPIPADLAWLRGVE